MLRVSLLAIPSILFMDFYSKEMGDAGIFCSGLNFVLHLLTASSNMNIFDYIQ